MEKFNLKPLALTFAASGIWDAVAGILYLTTIGTGRLIDDPPTHHFYSTIIACSRHITWQGNWSGGKTERLNQIEFNNVNLQEISYNGYSTNF